MGTRKIVGFVLLVVGVVVLHFGLQATDAPLEQAREGLTGDYSDETVLYLIGGAAAAVAGLPVGAVRRPTLARSEEPCPIRS